MNKNSNVEKPLMKLRMTYLLYEIKRYHWELPQLCATKNITYPGI